MNSMTVRGNETLELGSKAVRAAQDIADLVDQETPWDGNTLSTIIAQHCGDCRVRNRRAVYEAFCSQIIKHDAPQSQYDQAIWWLGGSEDPYRPERTVYFREN